MTDEVRVPTLEDMQAIAEAAARSAVDALSADDRAAKGTAGAKAEAESRGLNLPEEVLTQIGDLLRNPADFIRMIGDSAADSTIAQLEARGAFTGEEEGEEGSAGGDGETGREEGEGAEGKPAGDPTGGDIDKPNKSWAERFLGM